MKEIIIFEDGGFETQNWTWRAEVQNGEIKAEIFNLQGGQKKFYEIKMGQYGQPVVIQEPDLAFESPEGVGDGKQKIAGIITDDGQRFSLSNFMQKNNLSANDIKNLWNKEEMSFVINLKKYYLQFLYEPDKNRIVNYVGFFCKYKKVKHDGERCVKVYEMAEVLEKFAFNA